MHRVRHILCELVPRWEVKALMAAVELQRQSERPTLAVVAAFRSSDGEEKRFKDILIFNHCIVVDVADGSRETGQRGDEIFFCQDFFRLQISPRHEPPFFMIPCGLRVNLGLPAFIEYLLISPSFRGSANIIHDAVPSHETGFPGNH